MGDRERVGAMGAGRGTIDIEAAVPCVHCGSPDKRCLTAVRQGAGYGAETFFSQRAGRTSPEGLAIAVRSELRWIQTRNRAAKSEATEV